MAGSEGGDDGEPAVVSPTAPTGEAVEPSAAGGSPPQVPQVTTAERGGQPHPLLPCLDIRRRDGADGRRGGVGWPRRHFIMDRGPPHPVGRPETPRPSRGRRGGTRRGRGRAGPAAGVRPGLERRKGVARKYFKDELPPGCDGSLSGRGGRGRTNEPGGMATMAPGHPRRLPPTEERGESPTTLSINKSGKREWTLI
ncbi:hypothetical protein THAOC_21743 [Thalassiosira oceanica]|uniref:Uncharacterized protein n=1 Tax=Thalassiosira oceanica TaxID=159749 RepID=K0RYS6_THAOC|nr:hypothetical protein THAOC_21743 [Thalassiosira oceanica]|eukprot:EJK58155.1 hypothetical protein THAOC_21743 [Thalassiosira oceanica]